MDRLQSHDTELNIVMKIRNHDVMNGSTTVTTSGLITQLHFTSKCTHEDQRLFWVSENSDTSWKVHCGVSYLVYSGNVVG